MESGVFPIDAPDDHDGVPSRAFELRNDFPQRRGKSTRRDHPDLVGLCRCGSEHDMLRRERASGRYAPLVDGLSDGG
jgi:hypothetical protein